MADENGHTKRLAIQFEHRSDGGPALVGPFADEDAANAALKELLDADVDFEAAFVAFEPVSDLVDTGTHPDMLAEDDEMPVDEPEEDEELITEIPVHGVATLEGRPTGDGRGFRPGAISFGRLPAPLGYEFEHGHGSDNSRVAIIGRIDEFFTVPVEGEEDVFEVRWRGVISTTYERSAEAIEHIIDGSYRGLSVIVDSVAVDVEEEREEMRARILADQERLEPAAEGDDEPRKMTPEEIEDLLDAFIGDGTQPTTWFKLARVRRFDMVPTGAFQEGDIWLGHEFPDELTPEAITASVQALEDCGCDDFKLEDVDLSQLSVEDLDAFDALTPAEQLEFARERGLVAAAFAPGTKDGPGWITHPIPTARIRRYWVRGKGAAKIRWGVPGDFNRCRMQLAKYVQNPEWLAGLCANMHKEAIGVWPGQEAGGRGDHSLVASAAPLFSLTAAVAPVDARYFKEPENILTAGGLVIDGDHVYGYIAEWNKCHIGQPEGPGSCTYAPRSRTNYAFFRTGNVMTTEGPVPVGSITMNTGHADGDLGMAAAVAHYDNTGTVIADVVVGENSRGAWFSGRLRPGVSDDDVYAAAASGQISGDWRWVGSSYELVAGLVVNVGGYVVPNPALTASAMGIVTITAAGIAEHEAPSEEQVAATAAMELTPAVVSEIAVAAVEAYILTNQRQALLEELAPAREELHRHQLRYARQKLSLLEGSR
jgi:hypothetical protein